MSGTPQISAVVACYNYGQYLDGCLRSIIDQTYCDWEVVVVDDGSTDDTPQVMERFAGVPNLRYVRRENGGNAIAKNTGIRESHGEFIAFLDADDLWEREKLAKQIRLFDNPRVGVVYSRCSATGWATPGSCRETPKSGNAVPRRPWRGSLRSTRAPCRGMVRNACYLTYCNRGDYFWSRDKGVSCRYYLRALAIRPGGREVLAGIAKNLLSRTA
jgi:glycosyltransferase involved in cell wall biosynthesis